MTEHGFKPQLSSSKSHDVFPLHHTGYLRNNATRHCCFPSGQSEWAWLRKSALQYWFPTALSFIHKVKTKSHTLANLRTQLLWMPHLQGLVEGGGVATGEGPQLGNHQKPPMATFVPFSDSQTCSKIDGDPWKRATRLLDLKTSNSNISMLFKNYEAK